MSIRNIRFLSGNSLKIIAALSMLADHIGLMFFPDISAFRTVGRLAMPIFAFMIAEGCRYTRNKLRYFLTVAGLAAVCQAVYFVFDGSMYFSILVTFSISILLTYLLQFFKCLLCSPADRAARKVLAGAVFALAVWGVYALNSAVHIDYGFYGCMLPVFASLLHSPENAPPAVKRLDTLPAHVLTMGIGTVLLTVSLGGNQIYSLLALPLLLLYSGKRGRVNMKYFFYIFYPLHLAVLEGIYILMN